MAGIFTRAQVAQHNTRDDCWISIDNKVYDVTKFLDAHPAGSQIILDLAGKDCTRVFWSFHAQDILAKYESKLLVGTLAPEVVDPSQKKKKKKVSKPNPLSPLISTMPHAEPGYLQGMESAFYGPTHKAWRVALREWINEHITPNIETWVKRGKEVPKEVFQEMGKQGLLAANLGPGPHLKGQSLLGGVVPSEEFDFFHEQILHEEIYRIGAPGLSDGLGCGLVIGLPPVFKFGTKELAQRVLPGCLSGEKKICLAISEPAAGSDVANVQCRAVKSPCGTYYTVTGIKKWITNGLNADYFSTAVRTGGKGLGGVSLLLIERGEGVSTKKIPTGYSGAAGTCLVMFENVKVPVANLLGKENEGFKCIMHNFNHERWFIAAISTSCARRTVEECVKWSMQRQAFGKPLFEQPVIRNKLGAMLAKVESAQAYTDSITFQMCKMPYKLQNAKLGGPIALLKVETAKINEFIQNEAVQIFGGRGLTQSGMGKVVWRFRAANQFNGILGGTNEVLADFAVRSIGRAFPYQSKL